MSSSEDLQLEIEKLRNAIRKHRDQKGDDRCWLDDIELYNVLPEGVAEADLRLHEPLEMMANCLRYISCRHNPSSEYVSPQRTIEKLTRDIEELKQELDVEFYRGLEKGSDRGYFAAKHDFEPCYGPKARIFYLLKQEGPLSQEIIGEKLAIEEPELKEAVLELIDSGYVAPTVDWRLKAMFPPQFSKIK
ncbi:MAG: hypothetical protein DWQ19_11975 [Crenarchaeota archaeon]|nr:MAG: hypothetical protein DWQ19_11975 [Thermoproteota archaeon]